MDYDIIIIGSGLGGLTAGAKLAKEGKKVLLIEQHNRPGGCATTFQRGDFTMEVGLHEMDGPAPGDMKTRIFNDLDVFNNVDFIAVPEFYRFVNDRYQITVPHDPVVAAERLISLFPHESAGINAYFDQLLNPRKKTGEVRKPDISVGEFLDEIISNNDLKLILLGNLGYFHDDPYSLSLAYYSVAQGSYYSNGASFIKGGSQKLSDYLVSFIRKHGGEVLLNHLVTGIKMQDNLVTTVCFRKKNDAESLEANATEIIANNSVPSVAEMLPGSKGKEVHDEISSLNIGASLLTVYFGFSKNLADAGHKFYSTFVYDSTVKSPRDILSNNHADFSKRSFTFVDYGQIESGLAPDGKSVGAVCCIDYLTDWQGLGRMEYESGKRDAASALISRLERIIPGINGIIEYCEVGTPATVKRYTMNPGGAVYGFAQNPSRKSSDSIKKPDNLHFASAWGKTGGGFSGAIFGGYMCAFNILRRKR